MDDVFNVCFGDCVGGCCDGCCDDDDHHHDHGGGGYHPAAGVGMMAAPAAAVLGSASVFDLVLAGAAGYLLYDMFGGNRPRLRHNNPNVRNFTPPPAPPPSMYGPDGRRAVLIGINYRGTSAELAGCVNDVQRVAQRLHGRYQLNVLTDDAGNPNKPTRGGIMNAIGWLTSGLREGGRQTLFFHFSGHGSQQEDQDGEEVDGLDETICPVDYKRAGMISDDDLKRHLLARIPQGNKILSIMDCCHSGTVLDLPFYAIAQGGEQTIAMVGDQMSEKNRIPCDALMISGCEDAQTSADVRNVGSSFVELADRRAGGALTSAVLVAFAQNPSHSLASLLFAIRRALQGKGFDQIPQISASQPYDMQATNFDLFPESFPATAQLAQRYRPQGGGGGYPPQGGAYPPQGGYPPQSGYPPQGGGYGGGPPPPHYPQPQQHRYNPGTAPFGGGPPAQPPPGAGYQQPTHDAMGRPARTNPYARPQGAPSTAPYGGAPQRSYPPNRV